MFCMLHLLIFTSTLNHPNIIRRYLVLYVDSNIIYMVTEFAEKGSLKSLLKTEKKTLTLNDKYQL